MTTTATTQSDLVKSLAACGLSEREIIDGGIVHPVIYLLQRAGYNPGYNTYHFEWEAYGPFSVHFAAEHVEIVPEDLEGIHHEPPEELLVAAERISPLLNPPARSLLDRYAWQRLVAMVDFLIKESGGLPALHESRPHPVKNHFTEQQVDMAAVALKDVGLP